MSPTDFEDWRARASALRQLGAYERPRALQQAVQYFLANSATTEAQARSRWIADANRLRSTLPQPSDGRLRRKT